jgi:hypothetical protein
VTTRPPAPGRLGVPPKLLWHQPRRRSSPCRAPDWNRVLCNCRGPCSALLAVGRRQPSAPCRPPTAGDSVERVPAMLRRVTDHAEGLELVALLRMLERLAGSSRAGPCPPEGAARCTPSGLSLALGGSLPPLPLALPALLLFCSSAGERRDRRVSAAARRPARAAGRILDSYTGQFGSAAHPGRRCQASGGRRPCLTSASSAFIWAVSALEPGAPHLAARAATAGAGPGCAAAAVTEAPGACAIKFSGSASIERRQIAGSRVRRPYGGQGPLAQGASLRACRARFGAAGATRASRASPAGSTSWTSSRSQPSAPLNREPRASRPPPGRPSCAATLPLA